MRRILVSTGWLAALAVAVVAQGVPGPSQPANEGSPAGKAVSKKKAKPEADR